MQSDAAESETVPEPDTVSEQGLDDSPGPPEGFEPEERPVLSAHEAWVEGIGSENPWDAYLLVGTEEFLACMLLNPGNIASLVEQLEAVAAGQTQAVNPDQGAQPGASRWAHLSGYAAADSLWSRAHLTSRTAIAAAVVAIVILGALLAR